MEQFDKLREKRAKSRTQFNLYKYYFIIGIISLIAVFFLPMLGTDPTMGLNLPTTFLGWVIYITTKICVAVINMLLFHCFMSQGKLNIKDHPKYLEACAILNRYGMGEKLKDPLSPDEWIPQQYRTKGITIGITSVLSAVILTQAVLVFDWISMLTYIFTIIMGVIFGLFQQDSAEIYWTDEFWLYAKKIEREMEAKNNADNQQQTISQS